LLLPASDLLSYLLLPACLPACLHWHDCCRAGKRAILADVTGTLAARKWARWLPISYALFAGLLGTQSVLYGKTVSMLLRTTLSGDSQLVRSGEGCQWGWAACMGSLNLCQLAARPHRSC
jgi:hypothetical protein